MGRVNKYVVTRDTKGWYKFSAGYVEYHRDLVTINELSHGLVDGGGLYKLDEANKFVILYGKSDDFGYPKEPKIAFAECYDKILQEIEDAYYYGQGVEISLDGYGIKYIDEKGIEHVVEKGKQQMQRYYCMPKEIQETSNKLLMQAESVLPKPSKHRGGRFDPKDAEKKKKAKRRAQKKARRK